MSLSVGEKLGPYEVLAPIGEGGMGQVWKARDTRLNRLVAIKKSHKQFGERFEREAQAIAALNHPNICSLYDVGPDYLVMEYVDGAALKGPLSLDQALRYASQICDALDAAHRGGIIHRDLKPGNILAGKNGVKVLDFGLAKIERSSTAEGITQTMPLTGDGAILGTLQYMSPEQLEGKEADARSDIFSLGVVLYELITGKRPFNGASQASLIAAVLKEQPRPLQELQPLTPPGLDRVIQTCLEKDPEKRWQSAREMKHALEWVTAETPVVLAPAATRRNWLLSSVAAMLAIALGVTAWGLWPKPTPARVARFEIPPPKDVIPNNYVSLSPDGRKLVFNAAGAQGGLWIRDLDALTWRLLPETRGAVALFWSPDSRFLGFGMGNQLKKMDISGGPPRTLCESANPVGTGSWNRDGVIIFGGGGKGPMQRVSEAGGVPTAITSVDYARGEAFHSLPTFLPDGKHFLYLRQSADEQVRGMYIGSVDVKPAEQSKQRLLDTPFAASYADGYVFFMHENTLMAQPFDTGRLQLKGEPVPVVEHVATTQSVGVFSVSPSGALAYRTESPARGLQLTWFDRQGNPQGTLGQPGPDRGAALSPDGMRAAVRDTNAGATRSDLWMLDFARGVRTRLTFHQNGGSYAVWSPDGSRIAYSAGTGMLGTLYVKASSGAGDDIELFNRAGEDKIPTDWSRDGRFLLYDAESDAKTKTDLWVLPMENDHKPVLLLGTQFNEGYGRFSPDMRWVAYASNESGRTEIYVRPFVTSGPAGAPALGERKWQVSKDGGTQPRWRADGKEIFFSRGRSKMAVSVKATGAALDIGVPQQLFQGPPDAGWDVTADGKRFLMAVEAPGQEIVQSPFTVLLNWQAGLMK